MWEKAEVGRKIIALNLDEREFWMVETYLGWKSSEAQEIWQQTVLPALEY